VQWEKELAFARSVAMHAGELALGWQRRGIVAESKTDLTPVTIADRESEQLIASRISEAFPDDGIVGEEGSAKPSRNGRRWIIDPIDGTRDFVRGLPLWSVLIGFEVDGDVVVGVAHFPPRNEQYFATRGGGAWLNDKRIRCSSITSVDQALLCATGLHLVDRCDWSKRLVPWMARFWAVRSLGGCVDAVMLASGFAEMWLEPSAAAWDIAPFKILFEEAGARFFNFDGGSSIYGGNCIGCVPGLEPIARDLIGPA
jgi:histidinol phosphatase-like enzyme (inositol monophosphatase family)